MCFRLGLSNISAAACSPWFGSSHSASSPLPLPIPYLSPCTRSLGRHPCSWLAGVVFGVVVAWGQRWLFFPWKQSRDGTKTQDFFSAHTQTQDLARSEETCTDYHKKCFGQQNSRIGHSSFTVSCLPTLSEVWVRSWTGMTLALLPRGLQGCVGLHLHRERGRRGDRPVWTAVPCFRTVDSVTSSSLKKSFLTHFCTWGTH